MTSSEKLAAIRNIINPDIAGECNVLKKDRNGAYIHTIPTIKRTLKALGTNPFEKNVRITNEQMKRIYSGPTEYIPTMSDIEMNLRNSISKPFAIII